MPAEPGAGTALPAGLKRLLLAQFLQALADNATLALMRDAIATDNPSLAPYEVQAEVLRRLRIARRLDEAGMYVPAGTIDDEP